MEYSSDKEFYDTYLSARKSLLADGWKEKNPKRDRKIVSVMFTKNGFAIYLLYGCEEEIKSEILI